MVKPFALEHIIFIRWRPEFGFWMDLLMYHYAPVFLQTAKLSSYYKSIQVEQLW